MVRAADDPWVVRRDHECGATVRQYPNPVQHLIGSVGVKFGGGFVGDHESRAADHRAADRNALLFTAGEVVRVVLVPM